METGSSKSAGMPSLSGVYAVVPAHGWRAVGRQYRLARCSCGVCAGQGELYRAGFGVLLPRAAGAEVVAGSLEDIDDLTVAMTGVHRAALEGIVQLGLLAMPLGNGLNAPPSNADIGRVITGALTDPGPHVGKSYRPTGPRLLAPEEIAAVFAAELGRPVRYRDLPVSLFLKGVRALGYPDFMITQLYWFVQDYRRNAFGVGAPTDAVLEVGGAPPEPFDQIVRAYLAAPGQRRRTAGTRLRAALHLGAAAVTRLPQIPSALPDLPHAAIGRLARIAPVTGPITADTSHTSAPGQQMPLAACRPAARADDSPSAVSRVAPRAWGLSRQTETQD